MTFDPMAPPGWQNFLSAMGLTLQSSTSQDVATNNAGVVTAQSSATYVLTSATEHVTITITKP